jgi:hypothetical protein
MKDIGLDSNLDLQIKNGDFAAIDSTRQHQQLLFLLSKGALKQSPLTGIGAINYLKDEDPSEFLREARQQLIKDGQKVYKLGLEQGKIIVEADYGS